MNRIISRRQAFGRIAALAAAAFSGACVKQSDEGIEPCSRKRRTIAHKFLDVYEEGRADLAAQLDLLIGRCADQVRTMLCYEPGKTDYDEKEIASIFENIGLALSGSGISYGLGKSVADSLQSSKVNCQGSSVLYVAAGQALHLPIKAVNWMDHMLVRWDPDGKHDPLNPENPVNNGDLNWETTANKTMADSEYFSQLGAKLPRTNLLRSLAENQLCGYAFADRGIIRFGSGDIEGAIKDFIRAAELDPLDSAAYINLGMAKRNSGDNTGALIAYEKGLKIEPFDFRLFNNRGYLKYTQGDLKGAVEDYLISIQLAPKIAEPYSSMSLAKFKANDLDSAVEYALTSISLKPELYEPHYVLGQVYARKGSLDASMSHLNRAIESNENFADSYKARAEVKKMKGDLAGSEKDFLMYESLK